MKSLFIIALFVVLATADIEACLQKNCPAEYKACKSEVFGCAALALKCKQQCGGGTDHPCMRDCSEKSGNAKLIAMSACGEIYCQDALFQLDCDVQTCKTQFEEECLSNQATQSVQCAFAFFENHPECECAIDY